MELINAHSILNNTELVSFLKNLPYNFVTTTILYNLQQPINSSISIFKNFVSNTNVDQSLMYPPGQVCNCVNSPFNVSYHDHIITGDLRIIKGNKLRKRS